MTTKECREKSGKCYVLPEGEFNDILHRKNDNDFVLYPERHLNFKQLANEFLPPPNVDVVTENPWIIGSYDMYSVFILEDGKWTNPRRQTFGTAISQIMSNLLGNNTSISRLPKVMMDEILGRG